MEWAGTQPWSNGKVGINGISYYAMNQWHVAPLQPPHLAALCIWEGSSDYYRELARHGGILCDFLENWSQRQVTNVQHGVGERGPRSAVTGEPVAGPPTLPEEELARNRADVAGEALTRRLIDDYYRARLPDFAAIDVPLLSAANWGGQGLHPRGNFEGYLAAGSRQKWLEVHGDTHFSHFYSNYGAGLQRRFFGHFLKGEDTGWEKQPTVALNIRRPGEHFTWRAENEWPLARTQWTRFYLHPADRSLSREPPAGTAHALLCDHRRRPHVPHAGRMTEEIEITGPVAAKLFVSSRHDGCRPVPGAAGVRSRRQGGGVRRQQRSAHAGRTRLAARLAPQARSEKSLPYRPVAHARRGMAADARRAGRARHRDLADLRSSCRQATASALTVRGKDYEYDGTDAALPHAAYPMTRRRPVHPHRSARPAAGDLRRRQHAAFRARQGALSAAAGHSDEVTEVSDLRRPLASSWPAPCRPSTSSCILRSKAWMAGSSPAMTKPDGGASA